MNRNDKRSQIRVMGANGDSGVTWSLNDAASMQHAREYFDAHAASLYLAFQDVEGVGHPIAHGDFDPTVHDNVVLTPIPIVG